MDCSRVPQPAQPVEEDTSSWTCLPDAKAVIAAAYISLPLISPLVKENTSVPQRSVDETWRYIEPPEYGRILKIDTLGPTGPACAAVGTNSAINKTKITTLIPFPKKAPL